MRTSSTPWIFGLVFSTVGFGIYFTLGLVAESALGLTPLVLLVAGILFAVTLLTYGEGASMTREAGGSATFARLAFNELVSFIAAWAVLIDLLVVLALAALSAAHYLGPVPLLGTGWVAEIGVAILIIGGVSLAVIRGWTARARAAFLGALALGDIALQVVLISLGVALLWDPELLSAGIELWETPGVEPLLYSAALALLAFAGLEAASGLASDGNLGAKGLRRLLVSGAVVLPLTYAAMAAIALMAVPVVEGASGQTTALGSTHVEAPFLGIAAAFDPDWLATTLKWAVVVAVVPTLVMAAGLTMLAISRHVFTLAVNRQIPSWLGRLGQRYETPWVAIVAAGFFAIILIIPRDIRLLAEIYALGVTLAILIAHLSIIRLRFSDPGRSRPFRVPLGIRQLAPGGLPVPALIGTVLATGGLVIVLTYHDAARLIGLSWMAFGLVGYFVYRKVFEGSSLTERVSVTPRDLTKSIREAEYRSILVPVFGGPGDAQVVAVAERLAAARVNPMGPGTRLDLIHVVEVPLSRALNEPPDETEMQVADRSLEAAMSQTAGSRKVDVTTRVVRARTVGAGIVTAAREGPIETVVIGGESHSSVMGGAVLGGRGARRPSEIGPETDFVLRHAPCRVLLIAEPDARP